MYFNTVNKTILHRIAAFVLAAVIVLSLAACGGSQPAAPEASEGVLPGTNLKLESTMELEYANQFAVEYYEGGYKLVKTERGRDYLVVPEGAEVPSGISKSLTVLQQPLDNIYLAATASMALFDSIDGLGSIKLSSLEADGWYVENAEKAMREGQMYFAGKYSEPDYETLLECGCDLAIESTMILHNPSVQEMIENLGIPVFIEYSSYEPHPLGRTEWVKLYGALLNKEEEAEAYFKTQSSIVEALDNFENTGKKAAFFYMNASGGVVVYASGGYVPRMIEIAGGKYAFDNVGEQGSRSSVNITMEEFYASVVDADYIIYNSSIDSSIDSVADLLAKSPLFKDFKAVQNDNVWCSGKQMYQATDKMGDLINDLHIIITDSSEDTKIFYKLK
ncbi:MAG: ABC transporter substrate-binding protein [Clostridia bacterium]|nr:ABC transporter substrate-binding protein [Clostridia bacterium]